MKQNPEDCPLFHQIQPVCISIIDEPTVKNVEHLSAIVQRNLHDVGSLQALQEYILFPADTVLRLRGREEKLTIAALQLMTDVLGRTSTSSAGLAADLLPRLFVLLGGGCGRPASSEELRLAAARCGTALLLSCAGPALDAVYSERGRLPLGHAVFQLTAAVRSERSRPLRLAALDGLLACAGAERPRLPAAARRRSSRVFVALLPGVLSALHAVFTGDPKQGHRVVAGAVRVWAALVRHVLSDAALAADAKQPPAPDADQRLPSLARTDAWLRSTAARLEPMVRSLLPLTHHHQPSVRRAVRWLAEGLLTECAVSLASCACPLLELMILGSSDPLAEERAEAAAALSRLQAHMTRPLLELVEDEFYALTTRLPSVVRRHEVPASLVQLSLLEGYLDLLGPRVRQLTGSAGHVRRLLGCLVQLVELRTDAPLVPYMATVVPHADPRRMPDFKRFRHFDDEEIWRRICSSCRLLGCHGDVATLLELLDTGGAEERVLWSQVLLGQEPALLAARGASPQLGLLEQLELEPLLALLDPDQPPLSRCLGLEALAHVARVTGGRHAALAVLALCPVLEAAGGGEPMVSEAARATLAAMAGERGVPALLADNVRRLAVHVRRRLAERRGRQAAPLLAAALMRFSGPEALPHLEETVRAVMRALDDDYERCGAACLSALRATVDAVLAWFPPGAAACEPPPVPPAERLLAHHARLQRQRAELARAAADQSTEDPAEGFQRYRDERDSEPAPAAEPEPESAAEPPLHVRLVRDVVLQSVHFLDCDVIAVQVDVLRTLSGGAQLLAGWQDELLPLAARCWQPLLRCCRAADPLLLRHALQALHALVAGAGDFLRRRVSGGPLGPLQAWLEAQAATSAAQRPAASYAHTQARKLQLSSLQLLGDVAVRLRLDPLEVGALLRAARPYLSGRQPAELQRAALHLLTTVAAADGDSVWLLLRHVVDGAGERPELRPLYRNARAALDALGGAEERREADTDRS
ncbi:TELO2-interacting protein 1 [Amphibalanus amphitrite]|uniref:TELO2-interacting protein 1 n=1 Tax=Amphibalanus amphitrite TaxID=1232801 RepID=A0A6A4WH83_AMPAM|nr:TELO2-interacting protein 1 homolog [Amphibalanus amphitrite]KAF0306806.1 TELO2-interacting protein 1 [Amphibalanus amphitrite]